MPDERLWYRPNPAHKTHTCEEGPPRWYPAKTACPETMTLAERDELLATSVPASDDPLDPSRFAVRRAEGRLEWFRSLLTRHHPNGRIEVHGHPFEPGFPKVPPRALRQLREQGAITNAEYQKLVKA